MFQGPPPPSSSSDQKSPSSAGGFWGCGEEEEEEEDCSPGGHTLPSPPANNLWNFFWCVCVPNFTSCHVMCQNVFSRSYLGGFFGGALCCSAALSSGPSSSSPTGVTAAEDVETGGRSSTDVEERVPVEVGASNWTKRRQRPPPPPPPPPPRPKSAARDGDLCLKNIKLYPYFKHLHYFYFTFHWPALFQALPCLLLLLLHRTSHLRSPSRRCLLLPPASWTMPSSCCSCTCSS